METYTVSIQLYPQLGGLGWLRVGEYRTMREAQAHHRDLIALGHAPARVLQRQSVQPGPAQQPSPAPTASPLASPTGGDQQLRREFRVAGVSEQRVNVGPSRSLEAFCFGIAQPHGIRRSW